MSGQAVALPCSECDVSAIGIGYVGQCGDLKEFSAVGEGFQGGICERIGIDEGIHDVGVRLSQTGHQWQGALELHVGC